eukprot:TRINITY_DN7185_c0_g1_i1.p1 TRINITY_DN7185_c0_g1~~TRINITY_DN7185_c0_g1_i1.p1  ORF type:complete len:392 (-),score=145.74 TRINITY_DN7185_c0_g1_i1:34-1209(-)
MKITNNNNSGDNDNNIVDSTNKSLKLICNPKFLTTISCLSWILLLFVVLLTWQSTPGGSWQKLKEQFEQIHKIDDCEYVVPPINDEFSIFVTRKFIDRWTTLIKTDLEDEIKNFFLFSNAPSILSMTVGSRKWLLNSQQKIHDSCAVVGNSWMLVKGEFGEEIDKNEAVFRINWAPIAGENFNYTSHTGNKTNYMFVNRFTLFGNKHEPPQSNYTLFDKNVIIISKSRLCEKLFRQVLPPNEIWLLSAEWEGLILDALQNQNPLVSRSPSFSKHRNTMNRNLIQYNPQRRNLLANKDTCPKNFPTEVSTGILAILTAMTMCKQVNIYGFGGLGQIHNYWTPQREPSWYYPHCYSTEYKFLVDLSNNEYSETLKPYSYLLSDIEIHPKLNWK